MEVLRGSLHVVWELQAAQLHLRFQEAVLPRVGQQGSWSPRRCPKRSQTSPMSFVTVTLLRHAVRTLDCCVCTVEKLNTRNLPERARGCRLHQRRGRPGRPELGRSGSRSRLSVARVRAGVLGPQRSRGVRKLNFYYQVQLRRRIFPQRRMPGCVSLWFVEGGRIGLWGSKCFVAVRIVKFGLVCARG